MALKPDRQYVLGDISAFMDEEAERGGVVSYNGTGSGVSMDQGENTVSYSSDLSGVIPAGVLMQDMVDKDLTQTHLNWYKDEVQKGGKVFYLNIGEVTTDMIYPGHSPSVGDKAYLGHSGLLATSDVADDQEDETGESRVVGRFVTTMDADGFARVKVNLP